MLTPDYEDLRKYVDFPNMPDAQKDECILAVWQIMEHFVREAYGQSDPANESPFFREEKNPDSNRS